MLVIEIQNTYFYKNVLIYCQICIKTKAQNKNTLVKNKVKINDVIISFQNFESQQMLIDIVTLFILVYIKEQ